MRRFLLRRMKDQSGVSGLRIVAEGIRFSGGVCVISWLTEHTSVAIYENEEELLAIHGHDESTVIDWYDPEPIVVR